MTTLRHGSARVARVRDRVQDSTLTLAVRTHGWFTGRLRAAGRDRGDVPGWVLVTLMTAALVVALLTLARPLLENMFRGAVEDVNRT
ncbi:hypothetical protein ACT17Q_11355 [Cellulomonas sp. CW35]|uniref:hypothetical protein n=1 Tax=Cellulomonas sp. CW35 TaxID=3458249 RepID=UPI000ACA663B